MKARSRYRYDKLSQPYRSSCSNVLQLLFLLRETCYNFIYCKSNNVQGCQKRGATMLDCSYLYNAPIYLYDYGRYHQNFVPNITLFSSTMKKVKQLFC